VSAGETPSAYEAAGVDYETLDKAKRLAITAAARTSDFSVLHGGAVDNRSRGESAVVVNVGPMRLGFVLECLGTKSMIANAYLEVTGVDRFDAIGYDTVAAVVNDCICVGALPIVVNAYFATGAASFYAGSRHASLVEGWVRGCMDAGASWGGGESPTLSGLVAPEEIDLAGSAIGRIPDAIEPILGERLAAGDEIVLIASSGLHANGASLVRHLATSVPGGLSEPLPSGRSFGEAVLDPSRIYVRLVAGLLAGKMPVHYLSHITGHGLRKLMRAARPFRYEIEQLPAVPEVLTFIAERAELPAREAYGTLNMGAGFACFVGRGAGAEVVALASALGYEAVLAGTVAEGDRSVVLGPLGVTYDSEELELR
jgi:phosphoribosylformylglycinamidine cyclo-ligase